VTSGARLLGAPRWLSRAAGALFATALATALGACATDLDTTRAVPKRGSLGQEMFTLVCDRVGAQALREDVTGASFHAVCHADARGKFADRVDLSKLVPLDKGARNAAGAVVPIEEQRARRGYRVARIEASGQGLIFGGEGRAHAAPRFICTVSRHCVRFADWRFTIGRTSHSP